MQRDVLVTVDEYETRIALLENSVLTEYYFERNDSRRLTGNIYKGRVVSIVQGIDAAFIDIGLGRNAFLFVSDVVPPSSSRDDFDFLSDDEQEGGHLPDTDDDRYLPPPSICDLLKEGQEILVQVTREPIGGKGSRVTTSVSLPGRYLVLLPTLDHIGISRRVEDSQERERLRKIAKSLVPSRMGVIVRTAGEGRGEDEFKSDMKFLLAQWERIQRSASGARAPTLIHEELVMTHRLVRDILTDSVDRILVDDRALYDSLNDYMSAILPELVGKATLRESPVNLFNEFGVDAQLASLRSKKVGLNCGGYLVIDETEALTAIDVNTGKNIGERNLEETVLGTNLEAAGEIARQMRLRDLGGIIIVDFIDMQRSENRELVMRRLEEAIRNDRSRTQILDLTPLGLVEITRKRLRKSLNRLISQPCPYCHSQGTILSFPTMMIKVLRRLDEMCRASTMKEIRLALHPSLVSRLIEEHSDDIRRIEQKHRKEIRVLPGPNLHFEDIKDGFSYDTASMLELT
jgi:ribonuclease G